EESGGRGRAACLETTGEREARRAPGREASMPSRRRTTSRESGREPGGTRGLSRSPDSCRESRTRRDGCLRESRCSAENCLPRGGQAAKPPARARAERAAPRAKLSLSDDDFPSRRVPEGLLPSPAASELALDLVDPALLDGVRVGCLL